jgi:hypothetical protein
MSKSYGVFVAGLLLAASACCGWWLVGSPAQAPAEERRGPVPAIIPVKWEYRLIGYHPVLENMEKELNKAGQDGWEAVGSTNGAVQHIIMKRPHHR